MPQANHVESRVAVQPIAEDEEKHSMVERRPSRAQLSLRIDLIEVREREGEGRRDRCDFEATPISEFVVEADLGMSGSAARSMRCSRMDRDKSHATKLPALDCSTCKRSLQVRRGPTSRPSNAHCRKIPSVDQLPLVERDATRAVT